MAGKSLRVGDVQYLEKRRRVWHCVRDVPLPLRKYATGKRGKPCKRMVLSLKTDSLEIARRRRPAALALFESRFDQIRNSNGAAAAVVNAQAWTDEITQAALEQRRLLARLERGDTSGVYIDRNAPVNGLSTPAEKALAITHWIIDDEADRLASEHGQAAADLYAQVARSEATPIGPLIEAWLGEADIEARSLGDHRRAVAELLAWVKKDGRQATVEAFDRRAAGDYVTVLLGMGLDRGKTITKRLWSLSSLWRFLIRKGYCEVNVWTGHGIGGGRAAREKQPERPFTMEEIRKLLKGPAEPVLGDLMRLALFSGARIEELSLLRAADIDPTERTMRIQADPKTPASRRTVPIHSAVWPTIERRIARKAADGFVLHELGTAPKEGRQRSMAISKGFGRYRAAVGVDDRADGQRRSLVNFHSFRRTFVTLAEQAGIAESTIRSVVGHKRQGMTFGTYSGGPSLDQRRQCVESVNLP
jgi:integrase